MIEAIILPHNDNVSTTIDKFLVSKKNKNLAEKSKQFGNCFLVAKGLFDFCTSNIKVVSGTFLFDKPWYSKYMLWESDVTTMINDGLDPDDQKHVKKFARKYNIKDTFCSSTHYWNEIDIDNKSYTVDLSGYYQFTKLIKTKKISSRRYIVQKIEFQK